MMIDGGVRAECGDVVSSGKWVPVMSQRRGAGTVCLKDSKLVLKRD